MLNDLCSRVPLLLVDAGAVRGFLQLDETAHGLADVVQLAVDHQDGQGHEDRRAGQDDDHRAQEHGWHEFEEVGFVLRCHGGGEIISPMEKLFARWEGDDILRQAGHGHQAGRLRRAAL